MQLELFGYRRDNLFKFENQIHVLNAPSPGATASLAIADHIIENYLK